MKAKWVVAVLVLGGTVAASFGASAGWKNNTNIVTITATEFSGALGVVRNLGAPIEYLYCSVSGSSDTMCDSRDAAGVTRQCRTNDSVFKKMVMAINDDSYIRVMFTFVNCNQAPGVACCTGIEVANGSEYAPKAP